ncbi:MAG: FHA domain-containing protein [Anaerolineae bacterium]|jgi:hypothetical protein
MTARIVLLGVLAGALGGLIGWLPGELVALIRPVEPVVRYVSVALYFILLSASIGATLGAASGWVEGSRHRARQAALTGALFGVLGGLLGSLPGEWAFEVLRGIGLGLVGRALGWAVVGVFIGLAQGVRTRSRARMARGLLGGFIGGYLGGGAFELISIAFGQGLLSRLAADIILGATLGGLIFAVEVWLSNVWLRVVSSGPQEGSRFDLSKPRVTIGSSERDDVLLTAPGIAPAHIVLQRQANVYWLQSGQEQVLVDGRPVAQGQRLNHENRLQLGSVVLLYQERRPVCPHCGQENLETAGFCNRCGSPLKIH